MSRRSTVLICISLLVLAGFLAGCDEDDPTSVELTSSLPTHPDTLMDWFVQAMCDMDSADCAVLLADSFAFHQDIPSAEIGDWRYADEVIYINNLFRGIPFENSMGVEVQPADRITIYLDGHAGEWVVSDDLRFPGTMARTYSVIFDVSQPALTLQVRNESVFFISEHDDDQGGTVWKLAGQVELPHVKDIEERTWGSIRSLYR